MKCEICNSTSIKKQGLRFYGKEKFLKFQCKNCGTSFTTEFKHKQPTEINDQNLVVTSAVDGFSINQKFFKALLKYCELNNAKLIVLPVNHGKPFNEDRYPEYIREYLTDTNINLNGQTVIMGSMKLGATLESPLHSMNSFSKGKNVIFGHTQVQLKTLPRKSEKYPAILTTTGTISNQHYGENKTSQKANFNHSFSAVFVDGVIPNRLRHLHFDGDGFYDVNGYYDEDGVKDISEITALVTGDEHVIFYDETILEATYGKTGIVNTLKPKYIVRHDVLDCYSISHHHKNNVLTKYSKMKSNTNNIENELFDTIAFINASTPEFSESLIISSNHNSHLLRWLNEADPKHDLVNAKIYHQLMYMMLDEIDNSDESALPNYSDPFSLWASDKINSNVKFLKSSESFEVHGIDVNNHGDIGVNGSRGSNQQYKDLPLKSVIGHSHTPGIDKGSYQVGTSSTLRLEYNKGLSSWHHCHCIIYPNGKRQLIFIIDGEWK